jgi:CheY-like chemotaxis protein
LARRILLADDSVTAQNMGRRILTDAGYEVVTVNNGSAALKKIQEQKPDLIVLDVYMPGYGGLEVCQRVKETTRIPVLLTVGKLEPFKPDEARRVKADAFIVKPFEASELLSALTKLEDKIVPQPQPQKPGRFAKTLAALEQAERDNGEKFGDSETGWKNRLIIPTGGKSEDSPKEDIPEPAMQTVPARPELVEQKPVAEARATEPATEFERPIPAGIPADITADEIAAISAAAANVSEKPAEVASFATDPVNPRAEAVQATTVEVPTPVTEAEASVQEPAEAGVLAQATAEVSPPKPEETAQASEKDSEVMAAIASLAPTVQPESPAPAAEAAQPHFDSPASRTHTGPRWVAQAVDARAEEAATDLHAEMISAQAVVVAEPPAPAAEPAPVEAVAASSATSAVDIAQPPAADVMPTPAAGSQVQEALAAAAAVGGPSGTPPAAPAAVEIPSDTRPKDAELAAAWQNWKQIRDSIVGSNLTEQIAEVAAAEIKADSEAAQAEPTEANEEESAAESDEPVAIASIVDSVLAELKPKLVEEIARKINAEKKASKKK